VQLLVDLWVRNLDFLEAGGDILTVIMITTFLMWTLILERYWYFRTGHRELVADAMDAWHLRKERTSWRAHQVRRAMISRISMAANRSIPLIKTLVALCPLLGLLGTVTGMIEVFDVMAIAGTGNPRPMAAGVSRATLPTMAGMVAALSGVIFSVRLQNRASRETEEVEVHLSRED
jgi:biopolymer transport protein ExbB